jgi:hypothetical protein
VAYTPRFDVLLADGAQLHTHGQHIKISRHGAGRVVLPTGAVVACDPLAFPETAPFATAIKPGEYPVVAWVADVTGEHGGDLERCNAALQLVVTDEAVATWELADEPVISPEGEARPGYPVDAGTGAFLDAAAAAILSGWDFDRVDETFIPAHEPAGPVPYLIVVEVDPGTKANVVTVSSGYGDGVYSTWLGRTTAGDVACFVTDFQVVPPVED